MKARIKSNGKIVEVISRFMPRKRNAASRDWVCNLSDGTCIDESQLEYIEESIGVLEEADDNHIRRVVDAAGHPGWDWTTQDIADAFIAGAKWQKQHDSELIEIAYNDGITIGMTKQKEQMMKDYQKWRRIKAGERLPCPAYVWTIAYDNYPDCFEGRLMPNIQGVKVGRDTWYLPVDVIHNLPKEDNS